MINTPSHTQSLHTKSKQNEFKFSTISFIETSLKSYMYSLVVCFISLLLGYFLKFVYPLTRESFYMSIISHFQPLVNKNYILISYSFLLLSIFLIVFLFIYESLISNDNTNSNSTENNRPVSLYSHLLLNKQVLLKIFHRLRYFYFFRLTLIYIYFIFAYFYFVIPIYLSTKFKISGHFFSIVIANYIYSHIIIVTNHLKDSNFKSGIMKKINIFLNLMIYYNVYSLLFTSWVFHTLFECIIGFLIGGFSVVIFSIFEFDHILVGFIYNQQMFDSKDVIGNN